MDELLNAARRFMQALLFVCFKSRIIFGFAMLPRWQPCVRRSANAEGFTMQVN